MKSKFGVWGVLCVAFCFFVLNTSLFAQSESGSASLEGTVRDQNGAVIRGANVMVKNTETGLERTVTSNGEGSFSVTVLPVGTYTVTTSANGFAKIPVTVTLTVGETTPVEIVLALQGADVLVEVNAESEVVDTESSSTGTSIPKRSIEDLPIRGRNFTEFVQLTPAVVQESDRRGLVIAGQRSINSNIAIDGTDYNDSLQGNQRGGNEAVFFFPQTAIREFQVVRSGANAEVGRTNAGFVNAVTKSGTNDVRGEVFYYNRNSRLTSPDAFGNDGKNDQNLFGGSIGGAFKKDKAFYFFGIEQNFLKIPFFVRFGAVPGTVLPSDLAALQGEQTSTNNPTSLFGRVDFNLNTNNTLNFQYTFSRLKGENFNAYTSGTTLTTAAATNDYLRTNSSNGVKSSLVTVISPTIINEVRGQIATDFRDEEANQLGAGYQITGGFGQIGGANSYPRVFNTIRYQGSDNVSVSRGRNSFKFGIDVNINKFNSQRQPNGQPQWRFSSLADYNNGIPRRLDQSFFLISGTAQAQGYQKELALFVQDKIKVSPNLTLNLGLRWEGQANPTPPNPNPAIPETQKIPNDYKQWQPRLGASWDVAGNGNTVVRLSAGLYDARTPSILFLRVFNNNNIVTQDVQITERSGACRTAVGAAIPTNCFFRGSGALVTFPNGFTSLPSATVNSLAGRSQVFGFDPTFKNPRSFQFSSTVEQKLGQDFALSIGFLRNSTWNLQRRTDRNLFLPTIQSSGFPIFSATRPNTTYGAFSVNESTAHSDYNALAISLRRRFARKFQFEANYTFARNRDDDSNERNFARETGLNPFNLKIEAGPSKQDVRHNFNLSGLYDLGYGFTMSGIIVTRTGFPFTALISDGDDTNNDANTANERVTLNGVVAKRFDQRQPKFFNLDVRLLKSFKFGENRRLAFSAEVFNVTRNTNKGFGSDSLSSYCTADTTLVSTSNPLNITCPTGFFPSVNAGVPFTAPSTARFGGPRQLQLGARFSF